MLAYRNPRRRLGVALAVTLVLQLAACTQDRLYVSLTTVLGLDASVNTARTTGRVQLGYDRYFVTWVPQTVEQMDGGREVMSALNCTEIIVSGLALKKFDESLATGIAATNFAKQLNEESAAKYFDCFTDR